MSDLKLVLLEDLAKLKLNKPVFVLGFPSVGLVGSIATTFLTKKGFRLVGTFKSSRIAPVAAIHDYMPQPPIRIMVSEKLNMVCFVSEISIPMTLSQEMADVILNLYKKLNARMMVILGGIALGESENVVYFIPSTTKMKKLAIDRRIGKMIKDGATTGVTALLLTYTYLKGVNALTLLSEANPDFGDPKASSNVLKALSKLLEINIDTKELDKEAKELAATLTKPDVSSRLFSSGSMYR